MPPAKRATTTKRPGATPRTPRPAAVTVTTPEPEEISNSFELGGEIYVAYMPKDLVWMEIFAAMAPEATMSQKAKATTLFLQACLSEADRDRIWSRMLKRPSQDRSRGMELIARIKELIQMWEPYLEDEFRTAMALSEA